jgi:hypothetical protein
MYSVTHLNRIREVLPNMENLNASPKVALVHRPPQVQQRRTKFITKLEEQKLLLNDPNHVRTVQRWTKVNGERQATTKQQAVRPWWKADPSGQVVMSIKFGAKPIEFEKGKAGIAVPSKDKLPTVIDTLIAAVRAGERDDLFNQAAKAGGIGKTRKAA